jgi:hypothetical protein
MGNYHETIAQLDELIASATEIRNRRTSHYRNLELASTESARSHYKLLLDSSDLLYKMKLERLVAVQAAFIDELDTRLRLEVK